MQNKTPLLDQAKLPEDLRKLSKDELPQVAAELRQATIDAVSVTGGHLGAGLGVIELTVALHYVFQTPRDRLIWDVGHQAYPHKILTGRRDRITTLRQGGGLSGFTRRAESEFDPFGAAHSSTSISAGLGMAVARDLSGGDNHVVAVIGDGAMSAGMAYEAMNNAGARKSRLLVVLNDNDMSIARPVGALSYHLARLVSSKAYNDIRHFARDHLPQSLHEPARRAEEHARGLVSGGALFEELGFQYIGPIDGHNLEHLVPVLQNIRDEGGDRPVLLHVITDKGHGYDPASNSADKLHAVATFNVETGVQNKVAAKAPSYTRVFADALVQEASLDPKIVAITAAMPSGTGLDVFEKSHPDRMFDVGIAEQHAVTFAAGLACEGLKPVVAIYSTFLQRGYDQLIHDVALQNLPVVFALDRAGIVGADGPTHCGAYDIAFIRCVPNMSLLTPADERETRRALSSAFAQNHPVGVRYPRGAGAGVKPEAGLDVLEWGKGEKRREGRRIALLAFGPLLYPALQAAEKLDATVVNMRFVKPLDIELVLEMARTHEAIVTLEEGSIMGGAGSAVLEALAAAGVQIPVLQLGLPDRYIEHGDPVRLMHECGLDAEGIEQSVRRRFGPSLAVVRSTAVNG